MKTLDQLYKSYNFSATRCYVIAIQITDSGYIKIEQKLPSYIHDLKGIFVSTSGRLTTLTVSGFITLNFNGQSFKSFEIAVPKTDGLNDCSNPLPLNEKINPNSFMQGYYYATAGNGEFPYTLSIYLHYTL